MRIAGALFLFVLPVLAQFRAGAGKRIITPDLGDRTVYLAGFGKNRAAARIHDDLYARCIAFATNHTLIVCGVDSIGLLFEDVQKIRDTINDRLDPPAEIVIAALGNHAAPVTNPEYNFFLIDRVAEAAVAAVHSLRPASLKLASVRNAELDGLLSRDRPPKVFDSELVIASAVDSAGATIATLANWAYPAAALGPANTAVTADVPGFVSTALERRLRGITVLVNGAIGGLRAPEMSFRKAELLGARVAELAAGAVNAAKPATPARVEYHETAVEVPARTVAGLIRIANGGAALLEAAVVPGKLFPELSVGGVAQYYGADFPDAEIEPAIKPMMTAPYRMLIGLGNDAIGCLIPKAEWDEKPPWLEDAPKAWPGEAGSAGPDAAARVVEAIEALLEP